MTSRIIYHKTEMTGTMLANMQIPHQPDECSTHPCSCVSCGHLDSLNEGCTTAQRCKSSLACTMFRQLPLLSSALPLCHSEFIILMSAAVWHTSCCPYPPHHEPDIILDGCPLDHHGMTLAASPCHFLANIGAQNCCRPSVDVWEPRPDEGCHRMKCCTMTLDTMQGSHCTCMCSTASAF